MVPPNYIHLFHSHLFSGVDKSAVLNGTANFWFKFMQIYFSNIDTVRHLWGERIASKRERNRINKFSSEEDRVIHCS